MANTLYIGLKKQQYYSINFPTNRSFLSGKIQPALTKQRNNDRIQREVLEVIEAINILVAL